MYAYLLWAEDSNRVEISVMPPHISKLFVSCCSFPSQIRLPLTFLTVCSPTQFFKHLCANSKRALDSSALLSTVHSSREYRCAPRRHHSHTLVLIHFCRRRTLDQQMDIRTNEQPVTVRQVSVLMTGCNFDICRVVHLGFFCCAVSTCNLIQSLDTHLRVFWSVCRLHVVLVSHFQRADFFLCDTYFFVYSAISAISRDLVKVLFKGEDS